MDPYSFSNAVANQVSMGFVHEVHSLLETHIVHPNSGARSKLLPVSLMLIDFIANIVSALNNKESLVALLEFVINHFTGIEVPNL